MIKVKITTRLPVKYLIRQTPNSSGIWENCQFFINDDIRECDWWIVLDGLAKKETVVCPKENTILITGECADTKTYQQKYLNQFGTIVTSQRNIKHPRVIYSQPGLPWMIGHVGAPPGYSQVDPETFPNFFIPYDKLKSINKFGKTKLLSVITTRTSTPGHKLRKDFIDKLKEHFGDDLDVFGYPFNYIRAKWDGIAPYKYHLALENHAFPDYWTEKLSDAYLGGAYPIYYGAPNIDSYFPKGSLTSIDINDFDKALKTIEEIIKNDTYEKSLNKIMEGRNLVLDKYNTFATIHDLCNTIEASGTPVTLTLYPEVDRALKFKQSLISKIKKLPVIDMVAKKIYQKYRTLRYNQKFGN